MRNCTLVRFILRFNSFIFHSFLVVEVSGGTLSFMCTLTFASSKTAVFIKASLLRRSIPLLEISKFFTTPLTLASSTNVVVLKFTPSSLSRSTSMFSFNNGSSSTSTNMFLTLATVSFRVEILSFCCNTFKFSTPKCNGNTSLTLSTEMSKPVFSDATCTTLATAQRCTGGQYKRIDNIRNSAMGVNNTTNTQRIYFFIIEFQK